MAIKSDIWKNEMNLLAFCWWFVEALLAEPFGVDEADEEGDEDLDTKGFDLLADELPFCFVVLEFPFEHSSSQINISSQCSSFNIESYVTHKAGPFFI